MDEMHTHETSTEASPQPMQFPAAVAVSIMTPNAGIEAPTMIQIKLTSPRMPLELVFETPDPKFIDDLVDELTRHSTTMWLNKANVPYIGNHNNIDPVEFSATLRAAVEAAQAGDASNNPDPMASEKE